MTGKIDVIVDYDAWNEYMPYQKIEELVNKAASSIGCFYGNIALLLSNDQCLQELNSRYRGKNQTTNVLSFPEYSKHELLQNSKTSQNNDLFLGNIAMSYDQIMRESKEYGMDFSDRFLHLLVHGVLHILGFDHDNLSNQEEMESEEIKILSSLSINNPYIFQEK